MWHARSECRRHAQNKCWRIHSSRWRHAHDIGRRVRRIADRHSGMHGQIGMAAGSACGAHAKSDGAMHRTITGVRTHCDGATHMTWAGESDGIANRPSSTHGPIGMAVGSACGVQTMGDGTMHKTSAAVLPQGGALTQGGVPAQGGALAQGGVPAQGGALAQGGKGAPNAASKHSGAERGSTDHGGAEHGLVKHGEAKRSFAEHGAAGHNAADNSGQRHTHPRCPHATAPHEPALTMSSDGHFMLCFGEQ